MKFRVGDRVRYKALVSFGNNTLDTGTVVEVYTSFLVVKIDGFQDHHDYPSINQIEILNGLERILDTLKD